MAVTTKTLTVPVQWKRFTSDAISSYLGKVGEPILDDRGETFTLRLCDGITPGGHPVGYREIYGIAKPTIIAPISGATGISPNPMVTCGPFLGIDIDGRKDTHIASTFNFYTDANKTTLLHSSGRITGGDLTVYDTSGLHTFSSGMSVYLEVEYEGFSGNKQASDLIHFTVIAIYPGAVIDGDIVVGQIGGDWLLAAPAEKRATKPWGLYGRDTLLNNISSSTNLDPNTGKENTDILVSAPYASFDNGDGTFGANAANYCRDLGYNLPNKEELYLVYSNKSSIDTVDTTIGIKIEDNYFWSSTEKAHQAAWYVRMRSGAFSVSDTTHGTAKSVDRGILPTRRIPI